MTKLKLFSALALYALIGAISSASAAEFKDARDFVIKASAGNEFEILSSQLAIEKSKNEEIKQFAQTMIDDHSKAGEELKAILPGSKVDPAIVPKGTDKKHQKIINKLKGYSGEKFDKEYIKAQVKAHKETVSLFRDYTQTGDDAAIKDFAVKTLPTLEAHTKHVENLKAAYK